MTGRDSDKTLRKRRAQPQRLRVASPLPLANVREKTSQVAGEARGDKTSQSLRRNASPRGAVAELAGSAYQILSVCVPKALMAVGLLAIFLGCQSAQTRLTEEREVKTRAAQEVLSKNVVLLDARPPFFVAAEPIPQAIPVQWRDFVTRQAPFENTLDNDLFFHARKLARMGVGPDTPVIVLGRGSNGDGDEGRLAWTLKYLGVKDVKFMTADEFRFPMQNNPPPDRSAVPMWKPEISASLLIENKPFLEGLQKGDQFSVVEIAEVGKSPSSSIEIPKKLRTEIRWDKIVGLKPEARSKMLKDLLGARTVPVVVVDSDGVKAASATLWLREAGYEASCLCTGLKDLKSQPAM